MREAAIPANEEDRMRALKSYHILDSEPEEVFNDLAQLASEIFNTPISLINLIDTNRQWFKAKKGIDIPETDRNIAFCAHTILRNDPIIVEDALEDDRFKSNPFVLGEPNIRFYAGAPLINSEGFKLGTICVLDQVPKKMTPQQIEILKLLSKQAVYLLETHKYNLENEIYEKELTESKNYIENVLNNAPELNYIVNLESHSTTYANRCILDILDYSQEEVNQYNSDYFKKIIHPDDLQTFNKHYKEFRYFEDEQILEFTYRAKHFSGEWHKILCKELIFERKDSGEPIEIIGTIRNLTKDLERYCPK